MSQQPDLHMNVQIPLWAFICKVNESSSSVLITLHTRGVDFLLLLYLSIASGEDAYSGTKV